MVKVYVTALVLVALIAGMTWAGPGATGSTRMRTSADVVAVAPVPAQLAAAAGERVAFQITMNIEKTWHLYAHEDTMFIGIDLQPSEGFPLGDLQVDYPAGHEGTFFGETVVMLEGEEVIQASAAVPSDLAAGEHNLELALTVQACDDKVCLAPTDIPVNLKLTVK
jgi:thiol:disulfide interchange protein DsbD